MSDTRVSQNGCTTDVRWLDNGILNLASNFVGTCNPDIVKRWSSREIAHEKTGGSKDVQHYMGGVDRLNFLISLYRINVKIKKWPVRVIWHFVDFAFANSWLKYRDIHWTYGAVKKDILDLLSFCESVAKTLIKVDIAKRLSVGRAEKDKNQPPPKNNPNLPAAGPVHDVR